VKSCHNSVGGTVPLPIPDRQLKPVPQPPRKAPEANPGDFELALGLTDHLGDFGTWVQNQRPQAKVIWWNAENPANKWDQLPANILQLLDNVDLAFGVIFDALAVFVQWIHFSMRDMQKEHFQAWEREVLQALGGNQNLTRNNLKTNPAVNSPQNPNITNYELLVTLLFFEGKTSYYDYKDTYTERIAPFDWLVLDPIKPTPPRAV
jgi:hypothetical protein